MGIADELEKLEELRRIGSLTEHEFQTAKRNLLQSSVPPSAAPQPAPHPQSSGPIAGASPMILGIEEQTWCTLMHLSQLLVFAGGIGIAVPIVMWVLSKDESVLARQHGARIMNWLISSLIYSVVAAALCFLLIGIPILLILVLVDVIFPVIGAMKSNEGKLWSYPTAIRFVDES